MSPVDPLATSAGGPFIAQSFVPDDERRAERLEDAIEHPGFGFVNAFSPVVTSNVVDTHDYFRDAFVDVFESEAIGRFVDASRRFFRLPG